MNLKVFTFSPDDNHIYDHEYKNLPLEFPIPNVGDSVPLYDAELEESSYFSGRVVERDFYYYGPDSDGTGTFLEEWELTVYLVVDPVQYGGE